MEPYRFGVLSFIRNPKKISKLLVAFRSLIAINYSNLDLRIGKSVRSFLNPNVSQNSRRWISAIAVDEENNWIISGGKLLLRETNSQVV